MQIWRSETFQQELTDAWESSVVTIGVFDGIHQGHAVILDRAVSHARKDGVPCVMITFDPHPRLVLQPDAAPIPLLDIDYRCELAGQCGVDVVYIIKFDKEFAQVSPHDFIEKIVVNQLHARRVVVGENFRFGAGAKGDCAFLVQEGQRYNFTVDAVELAGSGQLQYSSTYIRSLLNSGAVDVAGDMLGRPFRLDGIVAHGHARGRQLGFPTANIALRHDVLVPSDGVYAGWFTVLGAGRHAEPLLGSSEQGELPYPPAPVTCDKPIKVLRRYPCAISVGTNPTFSQGGQVSPRSVEAYVIDASGDLYGLHVAIEFIARVRGQEKFASLPELISTMENDIVQCRTIIGGQLRE